MFLLLIYIVYLALWFFFIFVSCFIAWKFSKSKKITVMAGLVAFLVMFWPAFGDYIPTWWAHKQLCEKEAGFKVYVTPEQWAEENPGVIETLYPYKNHVVKDGVVFGNERIGSEFIMHPIHNLNVRKKISKIIDTKNGSVLAEYIDFRRGYINHFSNDIKAIKVWMVLPSCFSKEEMQENRSKSIEFHKKLNTKWSK